MELADNPQWSLKTGEFIGNFDDRTDPIKHFSAISFFMWLRKTGSYDFDIVAGEDELFAEFMLDGRRHHISEHRIPLQFNWGILKEYYEQEDFYNDIGLVLKKLFGRLRPEVEGGNED